MSNERDLRKAKGVKVVNTDPIPVSASIDTSGLALESKQDTQITNQGTEGATPPTIPGTGIIGYLRAIFDRLGQTFAFNGDRLKVDATVTIAIQGDNATVSTVALSAVSANVLSANTDRKQFVIYNDTNDIVWVYYGTPAVFGDGIVLFKKQTLIEDKYRGQVTAIMDTGKTGDIQVTDVTT
jgi:hypothetical protein